MSEETTAFTAILVIDGKEICHCKNEGHGGMTFIDARYHRGNEKIIEKADAFLKEQVKGEKTCDGYLEDFVDDLVAKEDAKKEITKELKRMDRASLKKVIIVHQNELDAFINGQSNSLRQWEYNPKRELASIPEGQLRQYIMNIRGKLEQGQVIYNKNIPQNA